MPAIALTAGPAEPAFFRGRELGAGTDLWHYVEEVRAGRMTQAEFDEYEAANVHGAGHCNELGTASTIAALVEALGMSLPGTAAIPAGDARARCAPRRRPARARSSSRARACGRGRSSPPRRSTTRSRC